ncbi:Man1-Src1p-C-terminal domain-containing protein [Xylariaceae sp. FL1019]|nr:Man1-Src1p-C-terminal domain-containing protein [Xylariaceae sp. FL1019]
MSDTESLEYLQPGFDPKSLTIPRLRSILVAHNVPYSSNAKKAQLVDLFNGNVVPQSKKILAARARAKRTSKGIFDADSVSTASSSAPFDDYQEDLAPPPPRPVSTRRSRSPRKASTRVKAEEPEFDPPMPPRVPTSPSKRASRSTSRQLQPSDTDESELDTGLVQKKTRRAPTPKLKQEASDGLFRRTSDVFTADNPFQSGSSPAAEQTPRRRTTGHSVPRSSSKGVRRQTGGYSPSDDDDGHYDDHDDMKTPVPQVSRHRTPESRYKTPVQDSSAIEAGEEFTPQEQLELDAEEAATGQVAVLPPRQNRPTKKSNKATPIAMVLMTGLAAYAGWYRQEKLAVGYCGVGQSISSIPSDVEVPEWAQSILPPQIKVPQAMIDRLAPECEPCPLHATCYSDFSVRCDQDYLLKPHPLAMGGVVPLPPTCEPDGAKVRRVQAVADRAIEELRERTAKFECGELVDEEGAKVETPAIEERELKHIIDNKRSKKMTNQEFEELWGSAIGEIKQREEVEVQVKEASDPAAVPNTLLSSTSLARLPLTCAVRRAFWLGLARNRLQISAVVSFIGTIIYAYFRVLSIRADSARVPELVDRVLNQLAKQREVGGYEGDADDAFLFLPNLRDDILRNTHKLSDRERVWQRVVRIVEQNSNVRTGQRTSDISGEVGRAWEWIGPTAGDSGGRRRKSGRVSWGRDVKDEEDEDKSVLHHKWEEPRPVY